MAGGAERDPRESAWIARVVAHDDHEAFAELVRLHQSAVRGFLRRLAGDDWGRADDLAQETFWRAYRHIRSYGGQGRFASWLFAIAYQLFVTDRRRARGIVLVPLPEEETPVVDDPGERLAERRTFDELLATLRPEERAAVVLHYRHELTHPEVAETLALPVGTVKSLIRRARLKLREALEVAGQEVQP